MPKQSINKKGEYLVDELNMPNSLHLTEGVVRPRKK